MFINKSVVKIKLGDNEKQPESSKKEKGVVIMTIFYKVYKTGR